jgi:hypothetical protein
MLIEELLFEMPQSIDPFNFKLDKEKFNKKMAIELLHSKNRELVKSFSEHVNLYEIGRQFALIDEEERHIIYYMKWTEIFHKFVNHAAASQIAVWRDENKPHERLAETIFFDHLLPKYGGDHHRHDADPRWEKVLGATDR